MSTTSALRRRATLASFVVVVLAAGALVWFATHARGEAVRTVRLDDGGVWVSNSTRTLVGRLNTAAGRLDAGVGLGAGVTGTADAPVDVVQDGSAVLGLVGNPVRVRPIDPDAAAVRATSSVALPLPSRTTGLPYAAPLPIDVRGGTVALVDPGTGRLWAERVGPDGVIHSLAALAPTAPPLAVVGATAVVAVGGDGTVYAASGATGTIVTIGVDPTTGRLGSPATGPLGFTSKALELTVLGNRWVAFDPATALLHAPGLVAPIPVADDSQSQTGGLAQVALQQPGADVAAVLVQTPAELKVVSLDQAAPGGTVVALPDSARVDGQGTPRPVILSRPVRAGACLHGAWAVAAKVWYGRTCAATTTQNAAQQAVELGSLARGSHTSGVRLRVNRGHVVLNDLDSGSLWALDADPLRIDDWAAVSPQVQGS